MPYLPDLARLRVEVFRDFPYLYDGDAAYEQNYLRVYAETPGAAIIIARDGDQVVGAATCLPMAAETGNVRQPFLDAGMDVSAIFYFGESVLQRAYRGRGVGVAFFTAREAQAAKGGYKTTAFCAVQRPADHPLRPKDYVPLDEFWRHRGYHIRPELVCAMRWRDIGEDQDRLKHLTFWTKDL